MTGCVFCNSAINARKPSISCSVCKNQAHSTCISDRPDLVEIITKIRGVSWKCDACLESCITVNQSDIGKLVEDKVANAFTKIDNKISELQSQITKSTKTLPPTAEPPRYSDVLKNRTQPAIIIQPKSVGQASDQTRRDLKNNIIPSQSDFQLSKLKNLRNGGILIGCKTKEENDTFKKMVEEKLHNTYEVKEVFGVNPRVRIVGMSEKYSEDTLVGLIKKCNRDLFSANSECKLIKFFPTKKNKNIHQCVFQLDKLTYENVIKAGHVFIGFDSCTVFDAIEVYRCYTCNDYHHSSKKCNKPISCPLCSGNHDLKSCKSKNLKCSNCISLNKEHNVNVDIGHAVWDKEKCSAYIRARNKLRSDILADNQ